MTSRSRRHPRLENLRRGNRMTLHPILLAIVLVLIGSTDWEAELPSGGTSCISGRPTPEAACRKFHNAARRGWVVGVPAGTEVKCRPHPECFNEQSDCIKGFNCR